MLLEVASDWSVPRCDLSRHAGLIHGYSNFRKYLTTLGAPLSVTPYAKTTDLAAGFCTPYWGLQSVTPRVFAAIALLITGCHAAQADSHVPVSTVVSTTLVPPMQMKAQPPSAVPPHADEHRTLLLGAACVAEIDFARPEECVLQWSILSTAAESKGVSLDQQVRAYNSIFRKDRQGRWLVQSDRARWVRALQLDGEAPQGWPKKIAWEPTRARWLHILAIAKDFLTKPPPHPCPAANTYGGDCDDDFGACDPPDPCWVRIDCGDTAQAYWQARACSTPPRGAVISARIADGR